MDPGSTGAGELPLRIPENTWIYAVVLLKRFMN